MKFPGQIPGDAAGDGANGVAGSIPGMKDEPEFIHFSASHVITEIDNHSIDTRNWTYKGEPIWSQRNRKKKR